jgi:hypothetical protein
MIKAFNKLDAEVTHRVLKIASTTTTRDFLIGSCFLLLVWLVGWYANLIGQFLFQIFDLYNDGDSVEKIYWRRIWVSIFCLIGELAILRLYWLNVVRSRWVTSPDAPSKCDK